MNGHDTEIKEYALAAGLQNRRAARLVVERLQACDFENLACARIFAALAQSLGDGCDPDPAVVRDRLADDNGDLLFLHGLLALPAVSANVETYIRAVKDRSRRRRVRSLLADLEEGRVDWPAAAAAVADISSEATAENQDGLNLIDWPAFWSTGYEEADWLFEDVLAHGRGHALYASRKEGKSLFMLWLAVSLATGPRPVAVLYIDFEMGPQDVRERLESMGFGPTADLSRLRYALLPTLPPLDTAEGGQALMRLVDRVAAEFPGHHLLLVIDTIGRALQGEDNSSDTLRAFYVFTGLELKRRGLTWVRLDHSGKDPERGPRGSSAKGDDVDVVWRLSRTENGVTLRRELARMAWVPETVTFGMTEDPLCFRRLAEDWPAGTQQTAALLDRLGVPLEASRRAAGEALRAAGEGRRVQVAAAALRWRRERVQGGQP